MWWAWPHLRRVWAAMGAVSVGLIVSYLYSLSSRQPLPDQRFVGHLLNDYWQWIGGGLIVLAAASGAAARAHRQHEMRAPQPLRIKPGGWRARRKRKSPEPARGSSASGSALMVGREAELAQLQGWLAQIRKGNRRVVFVAGEPGIGKSTIVNAFLASLARDRTIGVARGHCVEQYGAGEPYMPILDGLTRLCRAPGGERVLAILHRLAPAWLVQMPSLVSAEDRVRLQGQSQGVTQQRMLREMAEALEAITAESPLVLLIEDLHWSDYSTLDLIGAIARRTEPARLMILGTYRPVEMLAGEHPLRALKAELELHQQCEELRLKLLSEGDVANYLHQRFASAGDSGILRFADSAQNDKSGFFSKINAVSFRSEQALRATEGSAERGIPDSTVLASAVYARSEGNPLFMVNVVDYLAAQGPDFDASKLEAPHNLRQMIERNLERLTPEEQSVLEAASVAGAEFSAAAVAAAMERTIPEIEACCTRLARREQFVGTKEPVSWPDGTVASGYRFHHALYQETLYGRLPAGHRVELHWKIAQREEAGYGERAGEIAAELANHFSRANAIDRAIKYFQIAGQQALQRSACVDAIKSLTAALDLLLILPESRERMTRELPLQMALGQAYAPVKNWSAPEVERSFTRAQQICEQLGDLPLLPVSLGLWGMYHVRGQFGSGLKAGSDLLERARITNEPMASMKANMALGLTSVHRGEFVAARKYLERSLGLYDRERDGAAAFMFGIDSQVNCLSYLGWTLWHLGYPDEAVKKREEAVASARALAHPNTLAACEMFANILRIYRREPTTLLDNIGRLVSYCEQYNLNGWPLYSRNHRGLALAWLGRAEEGIAEMEKANAILKAIGTRVSFPIMLFNLAEGYKEAARYDDALRTLDEALEAANKQEEHRFDADIYRLRGDVLLKVSPSNIADARRCFDRAIEIASERSDKSLELRAMTSLARLLDRQGNRDEARMKLGAIYDWFTEGFDTADLREAKAVLDQLNQSHDKVA